MPVHVGTQWPDKESAVNCPCGKIRLAFCHMCGCITNTVFDTSFLKYTIEYDNALCYSQVFSEFENAIVRRLIEEYDVRHKRVIDIGCGSGNFLLKLCEAGDNSGIGFDPGYEPDREGGTSVAGVEFVSEFYSAHHSHHEADLVCFKFVLEHIEDPLPFLRVVRNNIGDQPDTVAYCAVPNGLSTFRDLLVWDIVYEHCTYFSPSTLVRLFSLCQFNVLNVSESFGGQFLSVDARPSATGVTGDNGNRGDVAEIEQYVNSFPERLSGKCSEWQQKLEKAASGDSRAVLWGAGAKCVSFLNLLNVRDGIEYVVDINPHKQGKFVAGTGQEIVAPGFLNDYMPDVVIVMNSMYLDEVKNLIETVGIETEVWCA